MKSGVVFAIMNTSQAVVKVKLDNIHACTVDEPIAFAIPVQYSANWATWQLRVVRAVVS